MRRALALWLFFLPALAARVALPVFLAPEGDGGLLALARSLPVALASRLAASGDEVALLSVPLGPERAADLLRSGYDEVVVGRVFKLDGSVALTARRYGLREGAPAILGTATATAFSAARLLDQAADVLARLYAEREGLAGLELAHLLVVPGNLKLALGERRRLKVLALDDRGRPLKGLRFVFQVEDPGVARVDEAGVVEAVGPGETRVQVEAVGAPGAGRVSGEATVSVSPPAFGLRLAALALGERPPFPGWLRFGLRLSSSGGAPPSRLSPPKPEGAGTGQSALDYLAGFFAGVVTGGQLTAALDYDLGRTLLFHLEAYQRTAQGYFGAGLGFATPTAPAGLSGLGVRLVLGSYLLGTRFPLEATGEAVFPTTGDRPPVLRLVVGLGLDLYP